MCSVEILKQTKIYLDLVALGWVVVDWSERKSIVPPHDCVKLLGIQSSWDKTHNIITGTSIDALLCMLDIDKNL